MTNTNQSGSTAAIAPATQTGTPHPTPLGEADMQRTAITTDTSAELLGRLQAGDRDALEALLEATRPRLAAVALKIVRDRDDAEDVVQDAMLKVWKHVGTFEGRAALSTWLHRIVVNTALDHVRARRYGIAGAIVSSAAGHDEDDRRPPEAVVDETPEDLLAREEVGAVVRTGIAQLSLVHRQAIALRELDGESYQSIATIARCPVGTVMSRLHHARQRLAETLAPVGAELVRQAA